MKINQMMNPHLPDYTQAAELTGDSWKMYFDRASGLYGCGIHTGQNCARAGDNPRGLFRIRAGHRIISPRKARRASQPLIPTH
jgi:hypothetical protein